MADSDAPLSFARDIRPLFTDMDVMHMLGSMNLGERASVFEHGDAIYATVSSGEMPPPDSGETAWTPEMCATFKKWMEQGGPA
jgi:hypothetical protein